MTFRNDFHGKFVYPNNAEIIIPENGARRLAYFLRCSDSQSNHVGVVFGLRTLHFYNFDASFPGDDRSVNVVDCFRQNWSQNSLDQRNSDRGDILIEQFSAVFNNYFLNSATEQLGLKGSQFFRQLQIWFNLCKDFAAD